MGTDALSFRIIRSRSCSCTTTTSLASVTNRFEKVIVNMVFGLEVRGNQFSKGQERSFAEECLIGEFYLRALSRQHPGRNLQALPCCVHNADRPVSPLGPTDNLQGSTVKRVKRVEDLNIGIIRAQGIVGVGALILTFTVQYQREGWRRIVPIGFVRAIPSSYQ
jgi:hypothetical protein